MALAFEEEFCDIEQVPLEVTDDGFTRRTEEARTVTVAIGWARERSAFEELLVDRLSAFE